MKMTTLRMELFLFGASSGAIQLLNAAICWEIGKPFAPFGPGIELLTIGTYLMLSISHLKWVLAKPKE
jgi:hypothetical protein